MHLSIILTVYNKEKFLSRALDSLLTQNVSVNVSYEVLAIDDGSTDGSPSILQEYVKRDERLIVIRQDNQGLSMARNNGAKQARGEYIWFVDADDYIANDAVNCICKAIDERPEVISICGRTEGSSGIRNNIPTSLSTGREVFLSKTWESCGVFWIMQRSFLMKNNLSFFPGIYHEDAEFTPRMLLAASSIKVITRVLYLVVSDEASITNIPRIQRAFDYLTVSGHLCSFVDDGYSDDPNIIRVMNDFVSVCINNAFNIIIQNEKTEHGRFNERFHENPRLIYSLKDSSHCKYRFEAFLFFYSRNNYVRVYKTLNDLKRFRVLSKTR